MSILSDTDEEGFLVLSVPYLHRIQMHDCTTLVFHQLICSLMNDEPNLIETLVYSM